ncbi:MAG TPA: HAD family phosphatase [Gemmatimonadaceae bacterium]|nr:HAD family phosphatase [Gemmatimonadaceae bacterium]
MADGVLLDWEGVLADTADSRRDALRSAFTDEGIAFDDVAYEHQGAGRSVHSAVVRMLGSGAADATLAALVALRAERSFAARLAQGFAIEPAAARFVELAQLRAPVVIVTAAGRAESDAALRLAGLHDSCAAIVTADDVGGEAPAAASYELALAHLGRRRVVKADRVVALATTMPAIRSAREAGLRTIAVSSPAHVALEADAAVGSLDGLTLDVVDALLGIAARRSA